MTTATNWLKYQKIDLTFSTRTTKLGMWTVLAVVEESKPDHCMFKRVFLYERQIYVELVVGIAVHVRQWSCLYISETPVYRLLRKKYMEKKNCIYYNAVFVYLYLGCGLK